MTQPEKTLLGGLLPVRVVGTGPPLVVLGGLAPERTRPAGLAVRQELQPWVRLASDRTVYALRWRPTPRTPPAPTMADVAADVESALERAFDGPVDLLGVSTGGSIAQPRSRRFAWPGCRSRPSSRLRLRRPATSPSASWCCPTQEPSR